MGGCGSSDVLEGNSNYDNIIYSHNSKNVSANNNLNIGPSFEQQKKEFPDLETWPGERTKGIGIKQMQGYKCDLPINKLNEKREKFWSVRSSRLNPNYKVWRLINQACVYDELRANMLLEEYELTTATGCINHIVDKSGNHYFVPNYCINDPYFEKQYEVKDKDDVKKVDYVLHLYECTSNTNIKVSVSNTITGKELKSIFKEQAKLDDDIRLRLFFSGMEITDDHFLYQHNLMNGYTVQVMKLPNI